MLEGYKTDDISEIKLIVLFIIDRFGGKATRSFLTDTIMILGVANYFDMLHCLSSLEKNGLIEIIVGSDLSVFVISSKGEQTLNFFEGRIPFSVREKIIGIIESIFWQDRHQTRVIADFTAVNEKQFTVKCAILESKTTLFSVELGVSTRERAKEVCDHFRNNSQKIYLDIIDAMVPKSNDEGEIKDVD